MKIVRLTEEFPHEINRGLAPNVYYISREQVKQGHQVWVFAFTKDTPSVEEKDGFIVHRIKKPHLVRWLGGVTFARAIKKAGVKPDIVHGLNCIPFGWLFPIMKRILPAKYVMSIHGSINPLKYNYTKRLKSWFQNVEFSLLCRFLINKVGQVIAISDFVKNEIEQLKINKTVLVINPGINHDLFMPSELPEKKDHVFLNLIFIGRFSKVKGVDILLKACSILKDQGFEFRLRLVGGSIRDELYSDVKIWIDKNNLNEFVKIVPPLDQELLVDEIRNSDVLIAPSYMESFGKTVLEAQATGTPVIATSVGGMKSLINHNQTGILINPGLPQDLASAILDFQNNPNAKAMIQNAIIFSKNYSWKTTTEKHTQIFLKAR